jgi:hypothetical protein
MTDQQATLSKIIENLQNLPPEEFQKLYEKAKDDPLTKMIESLLTSEEDPEDLKEGT